MNVAFTDFVELATVLLVLATAIFGGVASTHVTDHLKARYGLEGGAAHALSYLIALALAFLTALATGAVSEGVLANPVRLATVILATLLANEKTYQYQKARAQKDARS